MMTDERPVCASCGKQIGKSEAYTYDHDTGTFSHWKVATKCGGAHREGPVITPGSAGAKPATPINPKHSSKCVCIVCRPNPIEPEPEILPVEVKA